jgi:hypothetical protein
MTICPICENYFAYLTIENNSCGMEEFVSCSPRLIDPGCHAEYRVPEFGPLILAARERHPKFQLSQNLRSRWLCVFLPIYFRIIASQTKTKGELNAR